MKKSLNIRLIHRIGRRGLSGAVIEGIFAANASLVGVMDCDLQHDESKLLEMFTLFKKNTSLDVVVGSRFSEDGKISYGAFSKIRESVDASNRKFDIFDIMPASMTSINMITYLG